MTAYSHYYTEMAEDRSSHAGGEAAEDDVRQYSGKDRSHLQEEIKALQSENESLKSKLAKDALGDVMDQVKRSQAA